MFKKILNIVIGILSILSIALCIGIGVKSPQAFTDLLGISNKISEIQKVPYYVNFGDIKVKDPNYKSQYFTYLNASWYMSWGSLGGTVEDEKSQYHYNTILGWNNKSNPSYGSYSYVSEVMSNIEHKDTQNYTYLLMDFDFNLNHLMEWTLNSFDGSHSDDSYLYLIVSHNQGSSWSISDTKQLNNIKRDEEIKFTITEDSVISRTTRYGLVLVSDLHRAIRIEMNQFIVSRLSVV